MPSKKKVVKPAKEVKKLRRPRKGRKIAGVCLAFANYFEMDIVLVRLFWIFLAIPGGLPGIVPYIVCWVMIPEE